MSFFTHFKDWNFEMLKEIIVNNNFRKEYFRYCSIDDPSTYIICSLPTIGIVTNTVPEYLSRDIVKCASPEYRLRFQSFEDDGYAGLNVPAIFRDPIEYSDFVTLQEIQSPEFFEEFQANWVLFE